MDSERNRNEDEVIIKEHPVLKGLLVRSDGAVFIPNTKGHYEHWTKGCDNGHGYLQIGYKRKLYLVHRLVAETFIINIENKKEVDHIDRNKTNNNVSNLRWVSHIENNLNRTNNRSIGKRSCDLNKKEYSNIINSEYKNNNREKYKECHKIFNKKWNEKNRVRYLEIKRIANKKYREKHKMK